MFFFFLHEKVCRNLDFGIKNISCRLFDFHKKLKMENIFLSIQQCFSKQQLTFYEYYQKLQKVLENINFETNVEEISYIISNECQKEKSDTCLGEKSKKTYVSIDECQGFSSFFPSRFSFKRDNFYSQIFGYTPCRLQLPKLIEMVKAYSRGLPPPNTDKNSLWNVFNLETNNIQNGITASIVQNNTREFAVFDAKGITDWTSCNDKSLSEIFTNDLYCCALTLDIDGNAIDVKTFGIWNSYPIHEMLNELRSSFRDVFFRHTSGRWNANKYPPKYHVWVPENKHEKKLSLRISVHFPVNVCYVNVLELQRCVNDLCEILYRRGRYLIVKYVIVNENVRFEKSNIDGEWYCLNENYSSLAQSGDNSQPNQCENIRIALTDYIEKHGKIKLSSKTKTFYITHLKNSTYVFEDPSLKKEILSLSGWAASELEQNAFIECFIDKTIYSENKSLRLPTQSKIQDGKKLRKFIPFTKHSTVIDALIHYPHQDCKACPGDFILIGSEKPEIPKEKLFSSSTSIEESKIVETIKKKYCMDIQTIKKIGNQKLCLTVKDCEKGKHFCLIKNDVHSSSKMYFVFDEMKHMLSIGCFSSNCQQKIREKGHKNNIPLIQLDSQ